MPLPDNRLRFPAPRIDFENDVGLTDQAHDSYPEIGAPLRFDHMRMAIIALLANQSSFTEPTDYRDGTLWFDLNEPATLKIRADGAWTSLADVIQANTTQTLQQWMTSIESSLSGVAPNATFSGTAAAEITSVQLPSAIRTVAGNANAKALLYVDGLLRDPRRNRIVSGTTLQLLDNEVIGRGSNYTVIITNIPAAYFVA